MSKQKIVLSVVMIVLTALFVGFSLFSVFAAEEQNVSSEVTVEYTAPSIDAKISATYKVDSGNVNDFVPTALSGTNASIEGKYLIFKSDATKGNVGSLKMNTTGGDFSESVLIVYEFVNTGVKGFKATLTVNPTANENVTVQFSTDGTSYNAVVPQDVPVAAGETVKIYVKATISNEVLSATYVPSHAWTITE